MTPKTQITSVDLFFLTGELSSALRGGRFDKAYQLGEKELKLKVYVSGKGSMELIITPGYLCISSFPRKPPEVPSSFAMQLRKNLENAFIREVRQHDFDRILEIVFEREDRTFILVAEFFSRGNIVLCDGSRKILGLLEWQRWKDRMLGVGQIYEYPPETKNPLEVDYSAFRETLMSSGRKLVVLLATGVGLGGLYAEEVCLLSGIAKDTIANKLKDDEVNSVHDSFTRVAGKIKSRETHPAILQKEGKAVDVIPFDLKVYEGFEKKEFGSFNDALDEYFSREEFDAAQKKRDESFRKEAEKLREIESRQDGIIARFEKDAVEMRQNGDLIYQNFQAVEEILRLVKEERRKGASWDGLKGKIIGKAFDGVKIEEIGGDGSIIIKVEG